MPSQSVATATRGLPDFSPPSPPPPLPRALANLAESTWADASTATSNASPPPAPAAHPRHDLTRTGPSAPAPTPASPQLARSNMDAQQRNQAVGNLLAALAPLSPTQSASATANAGTNTAQRHDDAGPTGSQQSDAVMARGTPAENSETNNAAANAANAPRKPSPSSLPPLDTDVLVDGKQPSFSPMPITPTHEGPFAPDSTAPRHIPLITPDAVAPIHELAPTLGDATSMLLSSEPAAAAVARPERREIEAFAKIEFEDGNYYITTYACELGRDAFAYRAALARAEEARQVEQSHPPNSSGRRSGLSDGMPRPADSQVPGSVVSEAGGFAGVDDPVVPNAEPRDVRPLHSHSSERSAESVVKPQEVLINPPLIHFDYNKMAERQAKFDQLPDWDLDDELPAPVTADHIPDASNCPLIPIHAMRNNEKSEVENHRSISRRHVKILWDFDRECFLMRVLGRNGTFLNDQYLQKGDVRTLRDGAKIQISNVRMTFRLPNQGRESSTDESEPDDVGRDHSPLLPRSASASSEDRESSTPLSHAAAASAKPYATAKHAASPTLPDLKVGPDGQPVVPRKRGPGRPPKDGIMSTRERKEREKAQRLAEARAANGGRTPPPSMKAKFPKPAIKEELARPAEPRTEKRKYKKRKRMGDDGDVVQSIEGGDVDLPSEPERAPPKKARQSKSPSPEYPPAESLTEEQLARPSEPYARLIYDILMDIHPKALPLKQIYRALKLKFPFFVHRVDSEGWQSSVRHNLNQEWNKLFEKGEKEGKGFAWKAIPGALQPQAERRRAAQQAAASKPKPHATPRQNPPPSAAQALNWHNSTPYSQPNGMRGQPPPFFVQGATGPGPASAGMPWPPPPGFNAANGPSAMPSGDNAPPFYPPHPGALPAFPHQPAAAQQGSAQGPPAAQGQARPNSAASTPIPQPTTSFAARNMPCTAEGLSTIRSFEKALYKQIEGTNPGPSEHAKVAHTQRVFASVKERLLHGAPHSLLPEGETKEELTIMHHVRRFIDLFKNPNFAGFSSRWTKGLVPSAPSSGVASPALPAKKPQPTSVATAADSAPTSATTPAQGAVSDEGPRSGSGAAGEPPKADESARGEGEATAS